MNMNKTEVIARRILGWKLNRWDRWYDYEKGVFIHDSEFQPEHRLDHAMLIVEKLEEYGFIFMLLDGCEVCFHHDLQTIKATGETVAQAITDAAYSIADTTTIPEDWI